MTRFAIGALAALLGGCAADVRDIGRAPHMSAVGAGLHTPAELPPTFDVAGIARTPTKSLWDERSGDLFRDARAAKVGDLITVVISMNDSATLGNNTNRSRDAAFGTKFESSVTLPMHSHKVDGNGSAGSSSSSKGQGAIDRSEKIQFQVAVVVTEVLPNGNLLISGSQEMRVNFELRELTVTGIVRPRDVSRDNTISYEKVAEARISYGGRGRLSEVQQPALVHQILDLIKPF